LLSLHKYIRDSISPLPLKIVNRNHG
jgi:hypothetical protein